ncbi:MAG: secretin N-terminal domain-containing protein [Candidatus Omnitrophota bacterium]
MKKNLKAALLIAIFFFSLFYPRLNAEQESIPFFDSEVNISLDFKEASLKDILKVFSLQSGLNFIPSEEVRERSITLYLDKVTIKEAIDTLFKANNLTYIIDKKSNIVLVKDLGKLEVETVTRAFALKYATVRKSSLKADMKADSSIIDVVNKLLSSNGSLIEDSRTNSLVITDIPSRMPIIAKAIVELDVPVPQILIEVEMLDVSKNSVDKLGVKFGETPLLAAIKGTTGNIGFPFQSWAKSFFTSGAAGLVGTLSINGSNTYQVQLDFLKTQSDSRILARPRILTLNNEPAEIKITTNEYVGLITTSQGTGTSALVTTSAERSESGVLLNVTPQVNVETGEIMMSIIPKVRSSTASSVAGYLDTEERSTKSVVRVKDGETVIIGGLLRNERIETITKLPVLGDIPFIGAAFRHKYKQKDTERELLIFITPRIVKDAFVELAQIKKLGLPEREQGMASGIDRQAIIATSLNNFEKKK